MKQLKDFTELELEQVGKKWQHPKTGKTRYYLNPVWIIENYGYIFGLSRAEEAIFINPEYKFWIEDEEVKSSLPFTNHKKKYILPAVTNNLHKMLNNETQATEEE
ncbi:hypothetical protein G7047_00505 [Diaphorobacter sp. HDW4A]|uniref:hypothetical protein n=1 Tax=Diaphorobacter sp. HDW4A TaxID=2714924 RepID=UPI00140DD56B|nr:hypothetical protein [Diaphorobacter sp. HDW4A]QIL78568.1 hypothetical protein G7047_00505 [Diaphorobacter sp. HDW4A]